MTGVTVMEHWLREMLGTLYKIHRAKPLAPNSWHQIDQQSSPSYHNFLTVTLGYHSKVNLVGSLDAENEQKQHSSMYLI